MSVRNVSLAKPILLCLLTRLLLSNPVACWQAIMTANWGIALLILHLIGMDFVRRGKSLKGPAKSNAGLYSYILFPFPKLSHWIFYTFDVTFGINHLSA
jgi:hypothetical protein